MRGFTLIEVLVALSIAAFALMALIGRLGASSDVQRTLIQQRAAITVAQNILAKELLQSDKTANAASDEKSGDLQWQGKTFHWRAWTEKTELERFVRRNVSVNTAGEPAVQLFIFLVLP
ncbi:MAG: type II secretion system minor pseudopilin GspI [Mariprofundaceae bacterium]|nr:type II secretion system minor pseudopilin GspI [Mariprofundaceae bacterium]